MLTRKSKMKLKAQFDKSMSLTSSFFPHNLRDTFLNKILYLNLRSKFKGFIPVENEIDDDGRSGSEYARLKGKVLDLLLVA